MNFNNRYNFAFVNKTSKRMKKLLSLAASMCASSVLFAGGIVTNTNQSASWVRMPAQDASVGIEAVYFNPAGLMKLNNGFHISISNQTIAQTKRVENFYTGPGGGFGLNESLYEGKVSAPIFPSVYAVYKMDKFAFSFGFNPVGGGGGAIFEKGLPSFEMGVSDLVPSLASQGVNDYRLDAYFEGTSVFFGYQGGVSYKINDMISVSAGVRYVTAKNTYMGHLKSIELYNFGGGASWTPANAIMTGIATQAGGAKTSTAGIIAANAAFGDMTLVEAEAATIINATQRAQLEGALSAFGSATNVTISTANAVFAGAEAKYNATAYILSDQEVDNEQTGSGITPIFSVNISPSEKLNIGVKYEMATKIELTNNTTKDFTTGFSGATPVTMFPDGEKLRNDMPAMLAIGASYKVSDKLGASIGTHYYFDKSANYGKKLDGVYVENDKVIDNNLYEIAAGLEYNITEKLLASGGFLYGKTGVNAQDYQSDLSYSLTSGTIGLGGKYQINEMIGVNLGFGYTMYAEGEKTVDHIFSATGANIPALETYYKDNFFLGIGVDLSF